MGTKAMNQRRTLISILNYNGSKDTLECIQSFYKYEDKNSYCIVIWDNASAESEKCILKTGILAMKLRYITCTEEEYKEIDIKNYELVLVFSKSNLGFAKGNNVVIRNQLDKFEAIILLNNDTEFISDTTRRLVEYLDLHKDTGCITCAIYYWAQRNKVWYAGAKFIAGSRKTYTEKYVQKQLDRGNRAIQADYITGCYLIVRSDIYKKYGILTEKFFFGEEDYEFCRRMAQNQIKIEVLLDEALYHKVGTSIKRNTDIQGIVRRSFIHHLNRFIDMKQYYSRLYWNVWRFFSSIYIFLLMWRKSGYQTVWIYTYIRKLNHYAVLREEIDKRFFESVVRGEIF